MTGTTRRRFEVRGRWTGALPFALLLATGAGCRGAAAGPPRMTASDVRHEALDPAPIKPDWILEGKPVARAKTLTVAPDENFSSALWDCTAGTFRWHFRSDELVHILEGEVTVKSDDGTSRTLRPGDVALFPKGLTNVWHVPRYVKKLAVHRSQEDPLFTRVARKLGAGS